MIEDDGLKLFSRESKSFISGKIISIFGEFHAQMIVDRSSDNTVRLFFLLHSGLGLKIEPFRESSPVVILGGVAVACQQEATALEVKVKREESRYRKLLRSASNDNNESLHIESD